MLCVLLILCDNDTVLCVCVFNFALLEACTEMIKWLDLLSNSPRTERSGEGEVW